ncbi:unnamed protein product [Acanthosepion pharaonis]|uniref:Calx-beta domain-containing protein n=1 Tax=Acanthosepion pharaonis TaxID=158019 RepID=A0A812BFJ3_ACAPH|nr:unnamed protein product [Sepia pharaonis]
MFLCRLIRSPSGANRFHKSPCIFSVATFYFFRRFRHAAVNALLGRRKTTRRHSAGHIDPVSNYGGSAHKWVDLMYMKGWSPSSGICTGYFLFASEKYSVFEGGGVLQVDVLFARALQVPSNKRKHSKKNILQNSNSTDAIPNSHMPNQLSMSSTAINLGSGLVSVDYETREGNARSSQDFQPVSGTLVFREDEYRKQIPINITTEGRTINTVDFFLILKNPSGNAGLGDPSVAHVVIIGRHEPGEFLFESAFCHADMKNGTVTAVVHREGGFDGVVSVQYQTMDGTALGGSELGIGADYIVTKDTLTFADGEITKAITIEVNSEIKTCKNFIIVLSNPDNGARIGERSAVVCFMNNDELAHHLGEAIEDEEEEELSWAMEVGGSSDAEIKSELMWYDYLLHFLTFCWKVIFAAIPPTGDVDALRAVAKGVLEKHEEEGPKECRHEDPPALRRQGRRQMLRRCSRQRRYTVARPETTLRLGVHTRSEVLQTWQDEAGKAFPDDAEEGNAVVVIAVAAVTFSLIEGDNFGYLACPGGRGPSPSTGTGARGDAATELACHSSEPPMGSRPSQGPSRRRDSRWLFFCRGRGIQLLYDWKTGQGIQGGIRHHVMGCMKLQVVLHPALQLLSLVCNDLSIPWTSAEPS